MTKAVKKLINAKQRHYNTYMSTRSELHKEQFKNTEKQCKKAVRAAKRRFEKNIAKNGNKRPFNAYIKSKTKSRDNVGPLKEGNEFISDNEHMASILNNAFTSVFSNEDVTNIPTCPTTSGDHSISQTYFTPDVIVKKIKKLKISSSAGPDGISSMFLHEHAVSLSVPLAILYNRSMQTGCVPEDWRTANVTPIFQKGSKSSADNYRPISLTSIPCKVMESIMRDDIIEYLTSHQLIKSSQHGFMSNRSCTTNLLEFLEQITKLFDEGEPLDIVYLDFSKAFDKVPHKRLLKKIESLGISGDLSRWIEAWLTNRKQRT